MELFTLGEGHYTEKDVTEAARAMTGGPWTAPTSNISIGARIHDDGVKTVLGKNGQFETDGMCWKSSWPAAGRPFYHRETLEIFSADNPDSKLIDGLAGCLRAALRLDRADHMAGSLAVASSNRASCRNLLGNVSICSHMLSVLHLDGVGRKMAIARKESTSPEKVAAIGHAFEPVDPHLLEVLDFARADLLDHLRRFSASSRLSSSVLAESLVHS